jgi:hypothetical protein
MFLGERNVTMQSSGLASVNDNYNNYNNHNQFNDSGRNDISRNDGRAPVMGHYGQLTPPDDFPITGEAMMSHQRRHGARRGITGWLEIWDYAGGSSFRGFVAEDASRGTKSLLVFFDAHSITRDMKQAYVDFFRSPYSMTGHSANPAIDSLLLLNWPRGPLLAPT